MPDKLFSTILDVPVRRPATDFPFAPRRRVNRYLAATVAIFAFVLSGCQPPVTSADGDASPTAPRSVAPRGSQATSVEDDDSPGAEVADQNLRANEAEEVATEARASLSLPRAKLDPDKVEVITFDDLKVDMEADQVFEPSMATDRVRQLDGQRVRIRGFIFPAIFQQSGIDKFPLVMNTQCKFGPGGPAHHIILVEMVEGVTTSFTVRPIAVEGRLTLQPWTGPDGNTWSLYHMVGEKVE